MSYRKLSLLAQNYRTTFSGTELKVTKKHIPNKEIFVLTTCVKVKDSIIHTLKLVK